MVVFQVDSEKKGLVMLASGKSQKASLEIFNLGSVAGIIWLLIATIGAGIFLFEGIEALLRAWQLPEYSHGPLIPILSGLLFLRQLKSVPIEPGPKSDRWIGVTVVLGALAFGTLGKLSGIADIVAYAMIIWVYGILLISFGFKTGIAFWPPVLHLVYMLPLPDTFYYKLSAWLQLVSSELGVWFLRLLAVPVFLEGNIIDLGVYKLHVAEACSGLRYLFPILSFSYIFAVLYRGPLWHKAVLLLSAAPITVLMNSVRIGVAGYIVNNYGLEWVEGFSHFFEGWVIFLACVLILFAMARIMLFFNSRKMSLAEALDLDTEGLGTQFMRLRYVQPSAALITAAGLALAASFAWSAMPERAAVDNIERASFATFPRTNGNWTQEGPAHILEASVAGALQADDYHSITISNPDHAATVGFFSAWYKDQTQGGVHSPEICLPGSGWEIAMLERVNMADTFGTDEPFMANRAIIQNGGLRVMVYYWFEQRGRRIAWDLEAKLWLVFDGILSGRTDGAMVRLTTSILDTETDAEAEQRLISATRAMLGPLANHLSQE
jgi:exosortase D (VPLPA-CTERM-specific)